MNGKTGGFNRFPWSNMKNKDYSFMPEAITRSDISDVSSAIKLRKFKISDLDQILKIEKSSFSVSYAYSKERFKSLYKAHSNDFIVAEKKSKVIGYIIAYNKRGFLDFDSIAVGKNYRGMGLGSRLMNFVLESFKNRGFKKASLEVNTANKRAMFFYKKIGFQIKKTLKRFYKDGTSAYRMEKFI